MKEIKCIEIEGLLNNAINGSLSVKDKKLAKIIVEALQEEREKFEDHKGNKMLVQIDTDEDFSINPTDGFVIELNKFGTYDVVFEMKKNESRSEALKRCLKTLNFNIREEKKPILESLLYQINDFAGVEIDQNGSTSFGGNATITAYMIKRKECIDFSKKLKIKF